jgi:hypothetical protein
VATACGRSGPPSASADRRSPLPAPGSAVACVELESSFLEDGTNRNWNDLAPLQPISARGSHVPVPPASNAGAHAEQQDPEDQGRVPSKLGASTEPRESTEKRPATAGQPHGGLGRPRFTGWLALKRWNGYSEGVARLSATRDRYAWNARIRASMPIYCRWNAAHMA